MMEIMMEKFNESTVRRPLLAGAACLMLLVGGCHGQNIAKTTSSKAMAAPALPQVGGWHVPLQSAADLRGFGKVAADFSRHQAQFVCRSDDQANILLGKMLADLFWDHPSAKPGRPLVVMGHKILIHVWQPYGAICAGRIGKRVLVVGGRSTAALKARLAKGSPLLDPGAAFTPGKPYPLYLDFYDLAAFKAYTGAMTSVDGLGLASHWKFVKQFGLGGLSVQSLAFTFQNPAPGVDEWIPTDYEVRQAVIHHYMIVPAISTGEDPLWGWNMFPQDMMRQSPTALMGAWCGAGSAGAHYASWGMSSSTREKTGWAYLCQAMNHYRINPAVGGWLIYSGSPGDEFGMHERAGIFWDYSAGGEASFRHYLHHVLHENLQAIGRSWHGNPEYFHSWSQVRVPNLQAFFGRLNKACLRINQHWQWRPLGKANPTVPPATGWVPMSMPPSEQQMFFPWEASFYRTQFNAKAWLARNVGKAVYLVCVADTRSPQGVRVWLNGHDLGQHLSRQSGWGPFGLQVTALIKPGVNHLELRVPGPEGKIFGPIFLTTTRPAAYPNLGRHQNARYVDLCRWQRWADMRVLSNTIAVATAVDPNRPIIVSGGAVGMSSAAASLASRYGCGVEFTGDGSWYHPWWDGLGLLDHFHATGEEGGTESGWMLSRELGWNLEDGDSSHSLFWTEEDYIKQQRATDWFGKHKRLIQLFGKAIRTKPRIVIMHSSLGLELGNSPFNWDIGRGELQAAHYDNAYSTGQDLCDGAVARYNPPILFDSGTEYMNAKIIAALRRYVENGGTFIALQNTGRSTITRPNTWPISKLTGFKVVATRQSGIIRFGKHLPILQQWAGLQFAGQGTAVDYLHQQHARGVSTGLKRRAGGTAILARWENSGYGAVGYRRLGKGRIIVLASTFWRNGHDVGGQWASHGQLERAFFHALFSDLGIKRRADAASPQVWTRKFITKNGLQTWLIAFNDAGTAITTAVKVRVKHCPAEILNEVTRQPVKFTYSANGWVTISHVTMGGYATAVFAIKQADLTRAIAFWWRHKTLYWKMPPISAQARRWAAAAQANQWDRAYALNMAHWKFYADHSGKLAAGTAWTKSSFHAKNWQNMADGPWHWYKKDLTNYHGIGLYRHVFTLPVGWKGRQVLLNLYNFNNPIAYDHADFYVNGSPVATYQKRYGSQTLNYDITKFLRFGTTNVLAVKVWGGKHFSGLCGEVWLAPEPVLKPVISLAGRWRAVQANYLSADKITWPGQTAGRYLTRTVQIPASWKGRSVYLHVQTPTQWLSSVIINGHPISYNAFLHPFGLLADINITPYLRYGRPNQVELWPFGAIPLPNQPGNGHAPMDIENITMGCASTTVARVGSYAPPADSRAAR